MSIIVVTSICNDNKWLDEWIQWHLNFGVQSILVYDTNKCKEDYPMSDYVISMCASKRVKVKNFRNKTVDLEKEAMSLLGGYAFVLPLSVDEYLRSKKHNTVTDALVGKTTSLSIRTYPYYVNDGVAKLMLDGYYNFGDKTILSKCGVIEATDELYVDKFPNRCIKDWKKHLERNERP